jgi:uncharacterized protein YcbX
VYVAELWRYPVKGCAGERLREAEVLADGIAGDRARVVHDARGRLVTARTRPGLLALRPGGEDVSPAALEEAAGEGAHLVEPPRSERFDDTPLLVATDGAIAALGEDGRRLRPNLVIGGVEGLDEREWPGRRLRAGGVEMAVWHLCVRCVVTTLDPDTCEQDPGVLERINLELDGRIALNCSVAVPGQVAVGDPVELA